MLQKIMTLNSFIFHLPAYVLTISGLSFYWKRFHNNQKIEQFQRKMIRLNYCDILPPWLSLWTLFFFSPQEFFNYKDNTYSCRKFKQYSKMLKRKYKSPELSPILTIVNILLSITADIFLCKRTHTYECNHVI